MSDYENTRAYITSRLEELGSLDKLAEEMPGSRRGNGWDSSKLDEAVFRVLPQPLEKLARKAIRPRVFRMIADWFRPAYATSRVAGPLAVIYFPLWYLTGYHECFYLRKGDYKIRVDKDVVAVEVDGETRDLMIEEEESKIVPEAFRRRLKRFAGLFTGQRRYFNLSDAIELAVRHVRAEMYVTCDGTEGEVLEEVLHKSWRTQRVFETAELNVEGTITKIATSRETKESVVARFQDKAVRIPESLRQLLSNTFQIEEISRYYIPYAYFPVLRAGRIHHVIVNAASAEIPDEKTVSSVKRQLGL